MLLINMSIHENIQALLIMHPINISTQNLLLLYKR